MSDNIVSLRGAEKVVIPDTNIWEASVAVAVKHGAIYGILIYVNDEGDTCHISIGADRASFRGLIEEVRDDILGN